MGELKKQQDENKKAGGKDKKDKAAPQRAGAAPTAEAPRSATTRNAQRPSENRQKRGTPPRKHIKYERTNNKGTRGLSPPLPARETGGPSRRTRDTHGRGRRNAFPTAEAPRSARRLGAADPPRPGREKGSPRPGSKRPAGPEHPNTHPGARALKPGKRARGATEASAPELGFSFQPMTTPCTVCEGEAGKT